MTCPHSTCSSLPNNVHRNDCPTLGLTNTMSRRDQMAMAALSGVVINHWTEKDDAEIVRQTVRLADALIEELDKPVDVEIKGVEL